MWTASITAVAKDTQAEVALVTFRYTDGKRAIDITERVSDPDSLVQIATNATRELDRIDAIDALVANPPLGEIEIPVAASRVVVTRPSVLVP